MDGLAIAIIGIQAPCYVSMMMMVIMLIALAATASFFFLELILCARYRSTGDHAIAFMTGDRYIYIYIYYVINIS
jgi:hypothetical protein